MNENTNGNEQVDLDEIVSLNIDDLDVTELEQRFELSIALAGAGVEACSCSDFTCGSFKCDKSVE